MSDADHAGGIAERALIGENVRAAVERGIGTQQLKHQPLRLERQHRPRFRHARQGEGVHPDVRAHFHHRHAGADDLFEYLPFAQAIFAIHAQRGADINIMFVEDDDTVARHRGFIETLIRIQAKRRQTSHCFGWGKCRNTCPHRPQ